MMHRRGQFGSTQKNKQKKREKKTFTSRAIAKKDSVLNLCNPFVLATHPPRIDQECLNHGGSDGRQICRIVSLDFRGVISRRLSKDVRRTFKFRIPNFHSLGAERGFRKRERKGGEPANVDTLTVAASPRDASGIKQLAHAQRKPSKFTKTTLKTGLCCADMRDDWMLFVFRAGRSLPVTSAAACDGVSRARIPSVSEY